MLDLQLLCDNTSGNFDFNLSETYRCDYHNRGHLDNVDQSDYREITIHPRRLVVNHNYHETK